MKSKKLIKFSNGRSKVIATFLSIITFTCFYWNYLEIVFSYYTDWVNGNKKVLKTPLSDLTLENLFNLAWTFIWISILFFLFREIFNIFWKWIEENWEDK